jgi:hypothetical protein
MNTLLALLFLLSAGSALVGGTGTLKNGGYITNGEFKNGTNGWSGNGCTALNISSASANQSMTLDCLDSACNFSKPGYIHQTITNLTGNSTYSLNFLLYCNGKTPNAFRAMWNNVQLLTLADQEQNDFGTLTQYCFVVSTRVNETTASVSFADDSQYGSWLVTQVSVLNATTPALPECSSSGEDWLCPAVASASNILPWFARLF